MNRWIAIVVVLSSGLVHAQTKSQPAPQGSQNAPATQSASGSVATDAVPVIPGKNKIEGDTKGPARIAREVRHELLMLPYYSLFDDLRFRVTGSTVELIGEVTDPSLKSQAQNAVKGIEGVEQVVNHIDILPPNPSDDRIRHAVARAVFSADGLSRYAWEAAPTIHIIVNNGRVRLVGVVDNLGDKNMAGIQANSVPGVFAVSNELVVQGG